MARLQVLHLPPKLGYDDLDYALVVDGLTAEQVAEAADHLDQFAQQIGARGVLYTRWLLDIPPNDPPSGTGA